MSYNISMIQTKQITVVDDTLNNFLEQCNNRGYKNNNSLESLKFDWCLDVGGAWFATYKHDEIISLSGCHPWVNGWRMLFRGVQTEARPVGLNRHHMQSYCFYEQLPLQLQFAFGDKIDIDNDFAYITTNTDNDASGKMTRINKTFSHLEKSGLVRGLGESEVYGVTQNTWLLNIIDYSNTRVKYDIEN